MFHGPEVVVNIVLVAVFLMGGTRASADDGPSIGAAAAIQHRRVAELAGDHLDYRAYLRAWFEAKKEHNPRFSHRLFARLAGQKSPSLLLHVMEGRRNLTARTTEAFVKALSLRAGEAQFFRLLVDLDQADSEEARNEAWDQISATRRFREARPIERGSVEYLSNWALPATICCAAWSDAPTGWTSTS